MGDDEKRKHERLQVSLWAVEKDKDAAYYHYISELSPGGLFLEKRLPLPVGARVELEINLPDGRTVQCQGSVVRQADDGKGNGVKFDDLSDDDKAAIESFLAEGAHGEDPPTEGEG